MSEVAQTIGVPDRETDYEDDFATEYEEPVPDLTDEENAYIKWQAFCEAFGISCTVTYDAIDILM